MLRQIAATASGDYVGSQADDQESTLLLTVAGEPLTASARRLVLNLTQQAPGQALRRFRLTLAESPEATGGSLIGNLAPLGPRGAVIAECPLTVRMSSAGLSATTRAESCQFGSGQERVGLAKEFLFAGDQVRIADRLVRASADDLQAQSVTELRFFRLREYRGWVGVAEAGQWRIARDVEIDTALEVVEPVDAAGMSLGILLELEHALMPGSEAAAILRINVVDAETRKTLVRSWSEADSDRIGLATEGVQVGLERVPAP
jgi:hypothetical protein